MNSAAADRSPGGPAAGRSRIRRAPCQEGGKVPLVEIPWARIARQIIHYLSSIRGQARKARIEKFELDEGFQPYYPPFRPVREGGAEGRDHAPRIIIIIISSRIITIITAMTTTVTIISITVILLFKYQLTCIYIYIYICFIYLSIYILIYLFIHVYCYLCLCIYLLLLAGGRRAQGRRRGGKSWRGKWGGAIRQSLS